MSLDAQLSIQTDVDLRDLILNVILTKNGNAQDLVPIPINSNWNNEIIICDEVDLDVNIFRNNLSLVEAIEKMNVLLIIIGDSLRIPFKPINVKVFKKNKDVPKNISVLIDKWICINEKRNKREKVLANKLNRIFYILHELETKEEVFMEDIIKVTGVSKRTVQRDFQFIREMLIDKDIAYDEFNKSYVLNDLI
jgi:hypothetical protein